MSREDAKSNVELRRQWEEARIDTSSQDCPQGRTHVLREFSEQASKVFASLRGMNWLEPIGKHLSPTIVPVGLLVRRGMRLPVVWMLEVFPPLEETCLGVRQKLGGDGLIVFLSQAHPVSTANLLARRIVVVELSGRQDADLALWQAIDALDTGYRDWRIRDASAIFDDVRIEFATIPGERHLVLINGREFKGFQRSDLKFLRLLYLAAARANDHEVESGGWVKKTTLLGDGKDHALEALRDEIRKYDHQDLTEEERVALIRTSPDRSGMVRLAVHPSLLRFDASLSKLRLIGEHQTRSKSGDRRRTPGAATLEQNLARARQVATKLLAEARRLGVLVERSRDAGGNQAPVAPRGRVDS